MSEDTLVVLVGGVVALLIWWNAAWLIAYIVG